MLKQCPGCGSTDISLTEMFCPNCGEALFSQTRDEPPRGGDAGSAATGPGQPYVMPPGANTGAPRAGGHAPLTGQALPSPRATTSYAGHKKRKLTSCIYAVVGIVLIAGVVLGLSYYMYVSYFKGVKMELAQPPGWHQAVQSERKDYDKSLTSQGGSLATVDFLYLDSGGQLLLGFHHQPAYGGPMFGLPDTRDLSEMEAFISEHRSEILDKYVKYGGDPAAIINALPLDCGNIALEISGMPSRNDIKANEVQIAIKKGTTQYDIDVVNFNLGSTADMVQYVVTNLNFK